MCDAVKTGFRGKFITLNAYIHTQKESLKVITLVSIILKQEKEQIKLKVIRRKEIVKVRMLISDL